MAKNIVLCLTALLLGLEANAQRCTISGLIQDSLGNRLENVTVWCHNLTDSIEVGTTTDRHGYYKLVVMPSKPLIVKFSHVGYLMQSISIDSLSANHVLDLVLYQKNKMLRDVEVISNIPLGVIRNDTTVYYASAYKVHTDATAFDLITNKLPGISFKDGKLHAHGEQVKEVMVDGKDFFKNDIVLALKNLPASIIREVQLFDKETDYARISGFNDGNTQKTINIVTKNADGNQFFGKLLGGYGTNAYYKAYGMVNYFQDERRASVFAQSNNINEQSFSAIELFSAMGSNNVTTPGQSPYNKNNAVHSYHSSGGDGSDLMTDVTNEGKNRTNGVGINFTDKTYDDKVDFSGHYMYNSIDNSTDYNFVDEYSVGNSIVNQQERHNTLNINNRLNLKIEYVASPNDVFIFKPLLMLQNKVGNIHQTVENKNLLTIQDNKTHQEGYISMNELNYLHRINGRGNSLGVNVRYSYNQIHESTLLERKLHENKFENNANIGVKSHASSFSGTMSYIQVLNRYNRMKFELGGSKNMSSNKRECYRIIDTENVYTEDLNGWVSSEYCGMMSNMAYIYSRRNLNIMVGSEYHLYTIANNNESEHYQWKNHKILPYVQMKYKTIGNEQLYLQYKTSKIGPTASQLQETVNDIDPLISIKGNIELAPSYKHAVSIRYVRPDIERANIFILFANYETIQNYMACSRQADENTPQNQRLTYTNMNGYQRLNTLTAYGFPVNYIHSNINLSSSLGMSVIPAYINGLATSNNVFDWNNSLTVGSNISEHLDFVIDVNAQFYNDRNKTFASNRISYWSLSYGGQLNWCMTSSLKLTLEGGKTQYQGVGLQQYNALICNAAVAYKFLRKKNAEIRVCINDLFNQNNNFAQITNEVYRRTVTSNVIGQYAMLTFTYNL